MKPPRNIVRPLRRSPLVLLGAVLSLTAAAAEPLVVAGITAAYYDEVLSARVAGVIETIPFSEGQRVATGDVLVALASRDAELEMRRRKLLWEDKTELTAAQTRAASKAAELEVTRSRLVWEDKTQLTSAKQRAGSQQAELEVALRKLVAEDTSSLEATKGQVALAKTDYESTRKLFESTGSVSSEEVETKLLELKNAESQLAQLTTSEEREALEYKMAVDQRDLTKSLTALQVQELEIAETREEAEYRIAEDNFGQRSKLVAYDIERLQIAESREELEYELAQESLRMRSVTAPIDGTVTEIFLDVGANCAPNQALVRLVDTSRCFFIANIDAQDAYSLAVDDAVEVEVEAGRGKVTKQGVIVFVSPVVDAASGLQEVKVLFDNADALVRPGVAGVLRIPRQ